MVRIAVVDDDVEFAGRVEKVVLDFSQGIGEAITVKHFAEGSLLLMELEEKKNYDIYILDVEMPELNGLELAGRIREAEEDANIVILSGFEKYALPAYKVRAYDYIMKDRYKEEIPPVLDRIRRERLSGEEYYFIQAVTWVKRMRLNEILYLEKEKKYVVFHCTNGRIYKERSTLGEVYRQLPHERFLYINKGCIVNMRHISSFQKDEVWLNNDEIMHVVSRGMISGVREALAKYWRK
ncbi:MAG: LytTR family DNA-binding domain-containing protein [Blautia sp.]|nr:LytTR family DNA-binding domain-containing protein [Blautia sp.]